MKSFEELQHIIAKKVNGFCEKNGSSSLYEPVNYIMQLNGKRMRPVLTLMAANLFTDELEDAIYPALAMEIFHNFTLMHDDIMDKAPLRRGQPTVHEKWNTNTAILSGDTMLVQSYQLLIKTNPEKLPEILHTFNETAIEVCEGQQLDMEFEQRSDVSIEEYIEMIRLKTSVLVGGAMKIGAITGGADATAQNLVYHFGESLGISFQLRDDYLDVFGEMEKTGKQTGGDILSDKKTFLLLRAFEKAGDEELEILHKHIGNRAAPDAEKINAIKEVFENLGLKEELLEKAGHYFDSAISSLDNLHIEDAKKSNIRQLARQLMMRES